MKSKVLFTLAGSTLVVAVLAVSTTPAFAAAAVSGTETYTGKVPTLKPVSMDAERW